LKSGKAVETKSRGYEAGLKQWTLRTMVRLNEVRRNEVAVEAPARSTSGFFHRRHFARRDLASRCPRQGRADGPICRIEVAEPWVAGLDGIEAYERIEVLYWLHESRRDLVRQSPANDGETRGTLPLRSPVRPNPIGTALATPPGVTGRRVCPGSRLPRRDAAHRPEARPLPVHAARPASTGRFRDG